MTDYEPRQISVSRDALRADLAEMELRLRMYFDGRIAGKAETTELEQLSKRVDLHEAGVFPPAWDLRIKDMVGSVLHTQVEEKWSGKHRRIELTSMMLSLAALAPSVALAIHYWG